MTHHRLSEHDEDAASLPCAEARDITMPAGGPVEIALSQRHCALPASLHFEEPVPAIGFAASPFSVQSETAVRPGRGSTMRSLLGETVVCAFAA